MATPEELYRKYAEKSQTQRALKKQAKRNRQPDRVRRRGWVIDDSPEGYEDLHDGDFAAIDAYAADRYDDGASVAGEERVMPRGERERRRANLKAVARPSADAPEDDDESGVTLDDDWAQVGVADKRGVVVEVSTGMCRVAVDEQTLLCTLRGALTARETGATNVVAVGDQVLVSLNGGEQGVVEQVLPRRSALARPDVHYAHLRQVIAANVEQLLIVASWREPAFWPELVDRYLVTAARDGLEPILCINKVDLAPDRSELKLAAQTYEKLGYRVVLASAVTGEGIELLRAVLRDRSTVLAGLSGVGKSSLLSEVQPGLHLRTGEVSERRHEGQHTTTQAVLTPLEMGGAVIDTPGIREFGLSGMTRRELRMFYPEIALAGQHCRFDDCLHQGEPGCAVRALARAGWIAAARYDSYGKILSSLAG